MAFFDGVMRHEDVHTCALGMKLFLVSTITKQIRFKGSLALWLFWRYHHANESHPDLGAPLHWYNIKVHPGSIAKPEISLSKIQHSKHVKDLLRISSVKTTKVTHSNRGSSLNMIANADEGKGNLLSGEPGIGTMIPCQMHMKACLIRLLEESMAMRLASKATIMSPERALHCPNHFRSNGGTD